MKKERNLIGRCPNCNKKIYDLDFDKNKEAFEQFAKTGLCKKCQKKKGK